MKSNIKRTFMVFGKTGVGKSATCNTLMQKNSFRSVRQGRWVTEHSQTDNFDYGIYNIISVDTPGLFDTRFEKLEFTEASPLFVTLVKEFHHALELTPERGVNALIICISGTERCDVLTVALVKALEKIFGKTIESNAILCITRADDFQSRDEYDNWVLECKENVPEFAKLVNKCCQRVFPIANKSCSWLEDCGRNKILEQLVIFPLYSAHVFEQNFASLFLTVTTAATATKTEIKSESGSGCLESTQTSIVYVNEEYLSIPLSSLRPNDIVLTTDGFQRYLGVLHKSHTAETLRFTLNNGNTIEVTPEHLLKGRNGFSIAKSFNVGDELHVFSDVLSYAKIVSITVGYACVVSPLTVVGTIIVNGCIASCFAYTPHDFSRLVYWPLLVGICDNTEKYTSSLLEIAAFLPSIIRTNLLPDGVSRALKSQV